MALAGEVSGVGEYRAVVADVKAVRLGRPDGSFRNDSSSAPSGPIRTRSISPAAAARGIVGRCIDRTYPGIFDQSSRPTLQIGVNTV